MMLAFSFASSTFSMAQMAGTPPATPYIEVQGQSTLQVVPDRITLSLAIADRTEGRDFISVDVQEQKLIAALNQAGIPSDRLSLENADSETISFRWNDDEIINVRSYSLLLHNAQEVKSAFNAFKNQKVRSASIDKVEHSQYDSLLSEARKQAMLDAKQRADDMLEAIGQRCGKPLFIDATNNTNWNHVDGMSVRGYRNDRGKTNYEFESFAGSGNQSDAPPAVVYRKIKLEAEVLVWFETL